MAQRIGLISDTHSFLDERVLHHFADCDQIWHAGDIGSIALAEKLALFKPFRAVYGNIDDKTIQTKFPENLIFEVERMKILITHIGGRPTKYPARVKAILKKEKPAIYICGHSHILMVQSDADWSNMLFINPGAAGNEGFHKIRTIMKFDINDKKVENMKVIELGKRGAG